MTLAINARFQEAKPPRLVDLIITDPPYNLGRNYGPISDALTTTDYANLIQELARWTYENTKENASLVVIHYPEFFQDYNQTFTMVGWLRKQIIRWCYPSNIGASKKKFTRSSRDIQIYTRGTPFFDSKADPEPYKNPFDSRISDLLDNGAVGRAPYDWWEFNLEKNTNPTHHGYANQLPKPLINRLILSLSQEDHLIADPCAGTGTVLRVARELNRSYWGCDANPYAPAVIDAE